MKCVAKTVSGATAELDIEPTDTLAELKVGRICLTLALRAVACSGLHGAGLALPVMQGCECGGPRG